MYVRFLAIFIGAFLVSLLIPALGVNMTKAPEIERVTSDSISNAAVKIRQYTDSGEMTLDEAISLFEGMEYEIQVFDNLHDTRLWLNDEDMKIIVDEKKILVRDNTPPGPHRKDFHKVFAVFSASGKWVVITPDIKVGAMAVFRANQFWFVAIPLVLGTILIILASITVAKPIKEISNASKRIAEGDFSVRLLSKGSGEIRELADNFNVMVEELSENEYLHKEFVSNVSHEFNTPITSIQGYAKLMKRDNLTPEQRAEYADIIIGESARLSRLSEDLLKLSELENKEQLSGTTEFSLDEQVRSVIILLQNSWESKNITLDIELDEIKYSGDEALLHQIWVNLVSNAIRYTEKNGKIKILLEKSDPVIFEITDNGRGMTDEEAENAFRRFYKADKSRSSKGTGLGLAIAKKIAELHGGDISVKSEKGRGTTFTVTLPQKKS